MYKCKICGKASPSPLLPCPSCAKSEKALEIVKEIYEALEKIERKSCGKCNLCSNKCDLKNGERGLCKLRYAENGKLKSLVSEEIALLHAYEDPLPTNFREQI